MTSAIASAAAMIAALLPLAPVQSQAVENQRQRVRQIVVYGNDPCPQGVGEIIVCARRPETDRFRIPENVREDTPSPESESWARRAESLESVGATGTQSCSTVGPGGFTGCFEQLLNQSREERAAQNQEGPDQP